MKNIISFALSVLALGVFVQPAQAAISPVSNIQVRSSNTELSEITDLTVSFTLEQDITEDEAIIFAATPDQNRESAGETTFDFAIGTLNGPFVGEEILPFGPHGPFFVFDLSEGALAGNYEFVLEGVQNSGISGCFYGMMLTDPMPDDESTYYSADTTFTVGDAEGCDDQVPEATVFATEATVVGDLARITWESQSVEGVVSYNLYTADSQEELELKLAAESEEPNIVGILPEWTSIDVVGLTINATNYLALTGVSTEGQVLTYSLFNVVTTDKSYSTMRAPRPSIGPKSVRARELRVNKLNHRGLIPTRKVVQVRTAARDKQLVKKSNVLDGSKVTRLIKNLPLRFAGSEVVARHRLIIENVYNLDTGELETVKSNWSKYSKPRTLLAL